MQNHTVRGKTKFICKELLRPDSAADCILHVLRVGTSPVRLTDRPSGVWTGARELHARTNLQRRRLTS